MGELSLEERVEKVEITLNEIERYLHGHDRASANKKRGWRWFVGIDANNPNFDEAVLKGQEWRNADSPLDTLAK